MSILVPLLMALAAADPADRLFDAPADYQSLQSHEGQPVWLLMAGCAKAGYQEAQDLKMTPMTATEEALAGTYGMTGEEMREADIADLMAGVERYLTIAMESMAADRGVSIEAARNFVQEHMADVEAVEGDYSGSPCIAIANAVKPAA